MEILQPLVDGLLLGGLYAVIAVGMSIMFGIVRMVNLAHGDLLILSSYLSMALVTGLKVAPLVSLIFVLPVMYAIGFALQRGLLNRTLGASMEPPLLVAFGVALIVQNLLLLLFTPDARSLATDLALRTIPVAGFFNLPFIYLVDFVIGVGVIAALHLFFKHTWPGRAIRAAADDKVGARLVGVDIAAAFAHAMGVSMLTAAVAGVLVGMTFTFYPHSGSQYLIISFGVVLIGGMGSMWGTMVGGVLIAEAQLLGAHFTRPGYQLMFGYLALLLVLGIRPRGLFSKVRGNGL